MSVSELRMKTVGRRKIEAPNVCQAAQQLTETAERIRGTRALVPRGVQRFETFEEAHEWMLEMIASTHVRPRPEDLVKICAALNREGARYLLIGGFAVIASAWSGRRKTSIS